MRLRKLSKVAVVMAFFLVGCAGPQIKTMTREKPEVKTLKSTVMASYAGPSSKIKKKSILAVKGTELLRFEIKGFFNEPMFMLVAKGKKIQAYFVNENAYFEGELFDQTSDNLAAIFINQTGKLKFKAKDMEILSSFTAAKDTGAPSTAEFSAGEYKLVFSFLEPDQGKELSDEIFEIKVPKNVRRISEQDINRYLSKWSK